MNPYVARAADRVRRMRAAATRRDIECMHAMADGPTARIEASMRSAAAWQRVDEARDILMLAELEESAELTVTR